MWGWGVGVGGGGGGTLAYYHFSIHEIRYFDTINYNFATFFFSCKTYNTGFTCFRSLIERKSRYFMGTMNHFTFQINSLIISHACRCYGKLFEINCKSINIARYARMEFFARYRVLNSNRCNFK